jgi:hypothetical protein
LKIVTVLKAMFPYSGPRIKRKSMEWHHCDSLKKKKKKKKYKPINSIVNVVWNRFWDASGCIVVGFSS